MLMKKSVFLYISLLCFFSCSAQDAKMPDLNTLKNRAFKGMVMGVAGLCGYELYKYYYEQSLDSTSSEEQSSEKVQKNEVDQQRPLTLSERFEHFAKGVGYSILVGASLLATYHCAVQGLDRLYAHDEELDYHETYEEAGLEKKGPEWEQDMRNALIAYRSRMFTVGVFGSLVVAIPYVSYYKYRLPHSAVAYMKKAFQ